MALWLKYPSLINYKKQSYELTTLVIYKDFFQLHLKYKFYNGILVGFSLSIILN